MEKGIFDGLKVLDCASFIAAPAAATVLSDFGADVIKIEPPGDGDPYRNLPNLPGYPQSEYNFAWMLEARNKRSLALDLSKPEGQAVLHKLAGEADVFITNYPPAVRARLGITYDHLSPAWATTPARWRFTVRSSPRSTSASGPARARTSVPT
jgi:crotonobetainyl-CoA:carnitine CoA-transferase CaiB-like acyl-CoA transferase